MASLLGIILVPLIFILPKPKFIIPIAIITATILILFIFIDTFVYNQYTFHLNGIILQCFLAAPVVRYLILHGWNTQ